MESNYSATAGDFEAIEEALNFVFDPALHHIFKNRKYLKKISVISFDNKFLYIWSFKKIKNSKPWKKLPQKCFMYRIYHNIEITKTDRSGWKAGVWPELIYEYLPKELLGNDFDYPKISGSLLGDFLNNQKKIYGETDNPYAIKEGYLATIVHEYGHLYYQLHKNWWFSNKKYNLDLLKSSLFLYVNKKTRVRPDLCIPSPFFFSEIFAFCCEYEAGRLFLAEFKKMLDR